MVLETVEAAVKTAVAKRDYLYANPVGYFMASMLAGLYVGLGIVLIFTIGGPLAQAGHPALKLLMGASFGIALTLVVFAGAELFTGNTLYMTLGWLRGGVRVRDLALVWIISWIGNLAGALALCAAVVHVGSLGHARDLIATVSTAKMGAAPSVLLVSGVLCNLLVCLALWTASRTRSDAAKIILICMCLMAFIASGFEHSIANMTLLGVGVLGQVADGIGWGGYFHNLLWVTLGNTLGGAVILAGAFHLMAGSTKTTNPEGSKA